MNFKNLTVTVVGLGVIGGSFAEGLKKIGVGTVYGIDKNSNTLTTAIQKNFIDKGFSSGAEPLSKSDIVILALYPNLLKNFILENNSFFKKNSVLTDVAGIKEKIVSELKPILRDDIDFILGHPMAGKEKQGIEFADVNVFKGANYILVDTKNNKSENIILLEKLIKELGFKNINYQSAKEHDEIIAFTSQLTHLIAVALVNSDNEKYNTPKLVGDSFRDLTRIAKINENLWTELFLGNKNNLLNMIEQFESELDKLKFLLEKEDVEGLQREFKKSTFRREKFDK